MSGALYLPAAYLIISKSQGIVVGSLHILFMLLSQLLYGYPFISTHPVSFLKSAFNLSRAFARDFTYNWRFLPQAVLSFKPFHWILLILHCSSLLYFLFSKWQNRHTMFKDLGVYPLRICTQFIPQNPYFIAEVFFICNF